MNFELLHQFGQSYPEEFDGQLDSGSIATTCGFNRRGTLLAVGCNDGRIVIWDFLTRGICKIITAHVHPVSSLSWSRSGRYLVSSSNDNNVSIWDVATGENVYRWRFSCPILKVQFNPRNDRMILACPNRHQAVLLFRPVDTNPPEKTHVILPMDEDSDLNIIASFDRRGQYIYCGNAKGKMFVIKVEDGGNKLDIVASFRVASSNIVVKQIEFAPKRKDTFLVNASDRVIRVYETHEVLNCGLNGEPEPIQRIQDQVNKTTWKKCCFSGGVDADYICAGSARQHTLCIYDRASGGGLVKILQGTKGETLIDVVWHPLRSIIASISSGVVSVWAQAQIENWSAFAPDFKELDENVEYEERESEFDVQDDDRSPARNIQDNEDEDEEVDVLGVQPSTHLLSSDEDESAEQDGLYFLPISLEFDEVENVDSAFNHFGKDASESPIPTKSPRKAKVVDIDLKDNSKDGGSKPGNRSIGGEGRLKNRNSRLSSKRNISSVAEGGCSNQSNVKKRKKLNHYDPNYEDD